MDQSGIREISENVINIQKLFGSEVNENSSSVIPFQSCQIPLLMIAGDDDQMAETAKLVS